MREQRAGSPPAKNPGYFLIFDELDGCEWGFLIRYETPIDLVSTVHGQATN